MEDQENRHPPWCIGHNDEGGCVGPPNSPGSTDGHEVWAWPTVASDGTRGVEAVVSSEDGQEIRIQVNLDPGTASGH